jgi:hypothetical protein
MSIPTGRAALNLVLTNKQMKLRMTIMALCPAVCLLCSTAQSIGAIQWSGNGNYYAVLAGAGLDWNTANEFANASTFNGMQGHLATITSAAENGFITSQLPVAGYEYWLGGYQVPPNQQVATAGWTWVNGQGTFPGVNGASGYANPYSNWSLGEPTDSGGPGAEQFLGIWAPAGVSDYGIRVLGAWNDEGNLGHISGYVVEYEHLTAVPEPTTIVAGVGAIGLVLASMASRSRRAPAAHIGK